MACFGSVDDDLICDPGSRAPVHDSLLVGSGCSVPGVAFRKRMLASVACAMACAPVTTVAPIAASGASATALVLTALAGTAGLQCSPMSLAYFCTAIDRLGTIARTQSREGMMMMIQHRDYIAV